MKLMSLFEELNDIPFIPSFWTLNICNSIIYIKFLIVFFKLFTFVKHIFNF